MSTLVVACILICGVTARAEVVIERVVVGDPGNTPDDEVMSTDGTTGYGGVAYTYNIGKYEVTNAEYAESLNAKPTVGDPNGLYNTNMGGGWYDIGAISRTGSGTVGEPWVYEPRECNGESRSSPEWVYPGLPDGVLGTVLSLYDCRPTTRAESVKPQ
ncbi:MAG: hypothetical protein JSU86_09525 [Phycisphaerales bacterium]|nr:MAG: hypothetical protein JSU86_09525 [Phycisphaerales bacterium]